MTGEIMASIMHAGVMNEFEPAMVFSSLLLVGRDIATGSQTIFD
jgi:hypothetical protein